MVEEGERQRPDDALARPPLAVAIGDPRPASGADGAADGRKIDGIARGDGGTRPEHQHRIVDSAGEIRRQHRDDLGHGIPRRERERSIGPVGNPARAQQQRLDLILSEHQRRQHESGLEHVAEPRLALDRCALPLQRDDVAIERADADAELICKLAARHRPPVAAQELDKIEQPLGARQGGSFSPADRPS